MKNQEGFISIILAIIITTILVGSGVYYYNVQDEQNKIETAITETAYQYAQQTQDLEQQIEQLNKNLEELKKEGALDWKTYTNNKYGFSFEYSSDWWLGNSPTSQIPNTEAYGIAFDKDSVRFSVEVLNTEIGNLKACKDLDSCVDNNRQFYGDGQITTGLSKDTFAGIVSKKETILRPNTGNQKYFITYVYKNNNLYIITQILRLGREKEAISILKEIIPTFKFLDDTSDWQTYINEEWNFSLQYPLDYRLGERKEGWGSTFVVGLAPKTVGEDFTFTVNRTDDLDNTKGKIFTSPNGISFITSNPDNVIEQKILASFKFLD